MQKNESKKYMRLIYRHTFRYLGVTLVIALLLGRLLGGGIYMAARPLLHIYITDSPDAIAYGILRMGFVGLPYFLCGMMEVVTGCLRGLGASLAPMIISVLGVCGIRLGWIFTIFRDPRFHSLESLFISYPISWSITFVIETLVFMIIYRRRMKQAANPLNPIL